MYALNREHALNNGMRLTTRVYSTAFAPDISKIHMYRHFQKPGPPLIPRCLQLYIKLGSTVSHVLECKAGDNIIQEHKRFECLASAYAKHAHNKIKTMQTRDCP